METTAVKRAAFGLGKSEDQASSIVNQLKGQVFQRMILDSSCRQDGQQALRSCAAQQGA
jgi:hypothetical protein